MPDTGKAKPYYGYVVIAAGILVSIILVGVYTSFSVFFKPMSSELGWVRATTSAAISVSALVMGIVGIATGRLTDKYGPRVVLIACGLFMGTGTLLMSQVSNLGQLYLFYGVLVGVGMTGADIPIITTAARWFVRRRGMMVGIIKIGAGIGIMVGPLFTSWLIANYDWRQAYIVIGTILLVGVTVISLFFKRDPGEVGRFPDGAAELPAIGINIWVPQFSLRQALATRQFWIFSAMWFSFVFSMEVVMVHIVPHVTDLDISETIAASVMTVIGGFSILGRFGLASLSDKIGTRKAYMISFSFLIAAFIWIQFARETWMFYLFGALYGTAHGASFALLSPIIASLFGVGSLGAILGMVLFAGTIGGLISPMLAGWIFDIMGNYELAFWISLAFSVAGLILISLLQPTSGKGEEK